MTSKRTRPPSVAERRRAHPLVEEVSEDSFDPLRAHAEAWRKAQGYDDASDSPPPALSELPPRRRDGTIAPIFGADPSPPRRVRHDGWTVERQRAFIERLAASASVTDAAEHVGMSRQSARDLYNRAPAFRAAWDEALRLAVSVLAETAFDRAVNGVQEQVWYQGRMVGFREKYNDRLLMFLLRVRDPLNFAPLDDLEGWQRRRPLQDQAAGVVPTLDRLAAAEAAWAEAGAEPPQLPSPADHLRPAEADAETPHT